MKPPLRAVLKETSLARNFLQANFGELQISALLRVVFKDYPNVLRQIFYCSHAFHFEKLQEFVVAISFLKLKIGLFLWALKGPRVSQGW